MNIRKRLSSAGMFATGFDVSYRKHNRNVTSAVMVMDCQCVWRTMPEAPSGNLMAVMRLPAAHLGLLECIASAGLQGLPRPDHVNMFHHPPAWRLTFSSGGSPGFPMLSPNNVRFFPDMFLQFPADSQPSVHGILFWEQVSLIWILLISALLLMALVFRVPSAT